MFYGLPVIGLLSLAGSILVAAYPPAREDGWMVPVSGIVVSALVVLFAVVSFPR